ncbi:hypothetical protein M3Y94_00738100 [Aphelenchoides besseyi]|nr:hypothetical protein M3Y94_00738100 [Aphelenchoides besseyi]KAI6231955.1 hypothetical protein M3Y95_00436100 [Aphelenchoides besseyi]
MNTKFVLLVVALSAVALWDNSVAATVRDRRQAQPEMQSPPPGIEHKPILQILATSTEAVQTVNAMPANGAAVPGAPATYPGAAAPATYPGAPVPGAAVPGAAAPVVPGAYPANGAVQGAYPNLPFRSAAERAAKHAQENRERAAKHAAENQEAAQRQAAENAIPMP